MTMTVRSMANPPSDPGSDRAGRANWMDCLCGCRSLIEVVDVGQAYLQGVCGSGGRCRSQGVDRGEGDDEVLDQGQLVVDRGGIQSIGIQRGVQGKTGS